MDEYIYTKYKIMNDPRENMHDHLNLGSNMHGLWNLGPILHGLLNPWLLWHGLLDLGSIGGDLRTHMD
jgi:hypothetical protein